MNQQFRIRRQVGFVPVVAGQPATMDLPRGYDLEAISINLAGTITVSSAYTAVRDEAPAQIIPRIELIANGRNTLYSAPMWYASFGRYDRRFPNNGGDSITTPPSNYTAATYNVSCQGVIDAQSPDTIRSKDSNFRTDGLQLWQLRFTFGNSGDVFVNGGGTGASTMALTAEVSTVELVELPGADGKRTSPNLLKKVSYQEQAVPATTARQEFRLPAGNLIKSIVVRSESSGEPSAAVINALEASSGTDVRLKMSNSALRRLGGQDYGFTHVGYHVIDFTRSGDVLGNLTELWDVTNQTEPKLILDVNGNAAYKAQAVITEFLPIASA